MSLDPVLLAGFVARRTGGSSTSACGTGALSFLLLARDRRRDRRRCRAAAAAGGAGRARSRRQRLAGAPGDPDGDVARAGATLGPRGFDLVATNPPYRSLRDGNLAAPESGRSRITRSPSRSPSGSTVRPGRCVPGAGSRPSCRPRARGSCSRALRDRGLRPARLRQVHPHADRPPLAHDGRGDGGADRRCRARADAGAARPDGSFSPEVAGMLGEESAA